METIIRRAADCAVVVPYVCRIFPAVERELSVWRKHAMSIQDEELQKQALASLAKKRFHCQGGSVYALYGTGNRENIISFIVALQTISDYLDNLCDRVAGAGEPGFRGLHLAMNAAVDPDFPLAAWYEYYPCKQDNGYLDSLVATCRQAAGSMPGYRDVKEEINRLASLYIDLQVFKHLAAYTREQRLLRWFTRYGEIAPGLDWWEFAAASGSTLGIFVLAAAAAAGPIRGQDVDKLLECYFPWICGLHILLDYYIDLDEDSEFGDLNFVSYYTSQAEAEQGLLQFLQESLYRAKYLTRASFHTTVIKGLLALYLSDPKAGQSGRKKTSQRLLRCGGSETLWMHRFCNILRNRGII